MRVRVCGHENTYWVEEKKFLKWKKLPSVSHFLDCKIIRYHPNYVVFYPSYEKAREVASEYLRRFGKNIGVTQEITR